MKCFTALLSTIVLFVASQGFADESVEPAVVLKLDGKVTDPATLDLESLPNIVLIVADDLGYGDFGCYGSKRVKTPKGELDGRDIDIDSSNFVGGGFQRKAKRMNCTSSRYDYAINHCGELKLPPAFYRRRVEGSDGSIRTCNNRVNSPLESEASSGFAEISFLE